MRLGNGALGQMIGMFVFTCVNRATLALTPIAVKTIGMRSQTMVKLPRHITSQGDGF